jgi:hypothetical protein
LTSLASYVLNLSGSMQGMNEPISTKNCARARQEPPVLRCILVATGSDDIRCYRPLKRASMGQLIEWLLLGYGGNLADTNKRCPGSMEFLVDPCICEQVDYNTLVSNLVKDKIGVLSLEDAGIRSG